MDQEEKLLTPGDTQGLPEPEAEKPAEAPPAPDPAEEWRAKCEELEDKYLRAMAEMDNFRKRISKERSEEKAFAAQEAIQAFLPAMDNLERALGSARGHQQDAEGGPAALEQLIKGVELIQKLLAGILEKFQVTAIAAAAGVKFDPKIHQALLQGENPDMDDGLVLEELQRGYLMAGRVLRPSLVKVNRKS